jgi:hypothetical protein
MYSSIQAIQERSWHAVPATLASGNVFTISIAVDPNLLCSAMMLLLRCKSLLTCNLRQRAVLDSDAFKPWVRGKTERTCNLRLHCITRTAWESRPTYLCRRPLTRPRWQWHSAASAAGIRLAYEVRDHNRSSNSRLSYKKETISLQTIDGTGLGATGCSGLDAAPCSM